MYYSSFSRTKNIEQDFLLYKVGFSKKKKEQNRSTTGLGLSLIGLIYNNTSLNFNLSR